jgi:peptidyl-prolyl cis-trans isomerase D
MLQKLRDRISGWFATAFLGVIALVFVFWGINFEGAATAAAARVNGESVPLDKVRQAWQERQAELQREIRDELPAELVKSEQRALLDDFVRRELLRQRTSDLGYWIGDQKLVDTLNSIPALQVDGKFSRDRYAALLRQQGRTEATFEADLREDLQIGELQRGIVASSFVTPTELRRRTELEGEQRDVDFVVVPSSTFEPAEGPVGADVERWFEANKSRFVTPETVALQYVELTLDSVAAGVAVSDEALRQHYDEIAPERFVDAEQRHGSHILVESGEDDAAARARAESLLKQAQGGADFATLARENSDDIGSKAQGGDLGWSTREAYEAPFADALFAMQKGEIRGPVRTRFGYHIIRLEDVRPSRQRPFEEVRAELEAEYRRDEAQSIFYERSQQLADESFAALSELDSVARKLGLPLSAVESFTRNGGGPFGAERKIIDAAFANDVLIDRQNSQPISLGDDRVVVLRVTSHSESRQQTLAEVRTAVVAEVRAESARAVATAVADKALGQLRDGALWAKVVSGLGLTPAGQVTIERRSGEYPPELVTAVFAATAPVGEKPTAGKTTLASGDPVLFVVNARRAGSLPAASAPDELAATQRAASGRTAASEVAAYMTQLERDARIKRNDKAFE